jgi:acyl dehydratase
MIFTKFFHLDKMITFKIKHQIMLKVNEVYTHAFSFSQEEVDRFAEVTGDKNPVHTNAEFASKTMFKKPVMHGMLSASLFSKVFGTLFPGEGTIYLKQTLNFLKPMYVDNTYEAVFTVKEVMPDKNRAVIETIIRNIEGKVCTSGEAVIMNPDKIKT